MVTETGTGDNSGKTIALEVGAYSFYGESAIYMGASSLVGASLVAATLL